MSQHPHAAAASQAPQSQAATGMSSLLQLLQSNNNSMGSTGGPTQASSSGGTSLTQNEMPVQQQQPAQPPQVGGGASADNLLLALQLLTNNANGQNGTVQNQQSSASLPLNSNPILQLLAMQNGGNTSQFQQQQPLHLVQPPAPAMTTSGNSSTIESQQQPNQLLGQLCQLLVGQNQPPPQQQTQPQLQTGDPRTLILQLLAGNNPGAANAVSDQGSVVSSNMPKPMDTSSTASQATSINGASSSLSPSNGNQFQLNGIEYPGVHDVLLGRGSGTSNHIGNINFRLLVNKHKPRYVEASRVDKPKVAGEVVDIWRKKNPPGRFLMRSDASQGDMSLWDDVGDRKARQKTSQCLREKDRPRREEDRKRKRIEDL